MHDGVISVGGNGKVAAVAGVTVSTNIDMDTNAVANNAQEAKKRTEETTNKVTSGTNKETKKMKKKMKKGKFW